MTPPHSVTPRSSMDAGVPATPDAGRPADAGPSRGRASGMDAGVPPPPPSYTPRTLAYSLAELGAASRERQRLLTDRVLLGQNYDAWRAARNTTYFNLSLAILRIQYYVQGSQTDLNSIRVPLEAWIREAQSGADPVVRDILTQLLENLRALREPYNADRAGVIIGMIEELQQPPLAPSRSPDAGTPPPPRSAPPEASPRPRPRHRRPDAGTPPPSRPDGGTATPSTPDAETRPPTPPPARPDAGVPPPPPPRSRRPILPPDAGVR